MRNALAFLISLALVAAGLPVALAAECPYIYESNNKDVHFLFPHGIEVKGSLESNQSSARVKIANALGSEAYVGEWLKPQEATLITGKKTILDSTGKRRDLNVKVLSFIAPGGRPHWKIQITSEFDQNSALHYEFSDEGLNCFEQELNNDSNWLKAPEGYRLNTFALKAIADELALQRLGF